MMIPSHIRPAVLGCLAGITAMILPNVSQAFIPTSPQLLYMMIRAIGHTSLEEPSGFVVRHTRLIPSDLSFSNHENTKPDPYSVVERLTFVYPNQLRAEIESGPNTGFTVESGRNFVKIINQIIISDTKSLEDHYTDILLLRNPEHLESFLHFSGIDTSRVQYDRYQEQICYRIGGPPEQLQSEQSEQDGHASGIWIDHETFLPVCFRLVQENSSIDFVYQDWQQVEKIWYPMHITMIMDNRIITRIQADHAEWSKPDVHALFDIDHIVDQVPKKRHGSSPGSSIHKIQEPARADRIKELDKDINDFKKMYE